MNRIFAAVLLMFFAAQSPAQSNSVAFVQIPALDDLGLIGMTLVVAIAGAIAVRRRKK
jgi:hypothetical protein